MSPLARYPPLVTLPELDQSLVVPIFVKEPLFSAGSKRKRVGLQILTQLAQVELLLTKIAKTEAPVSIVLRYENEVVTLLQSLEHAALSAGSASLAAYVLEKNMMPMFPKSSARMGIDASYIPAVQVVQNRSSDINGHFFQIGIINQLLSIAFQLQGDIALTNHKYMAHQIALLYQCLVHCSPQMDKFKPRIESQFDSIKALTGDGNDEPQLKQEQKEWLFQLTSDIIEELYSLPVSLLAYSKNITYYNYLLGR